LLGSIGNRDYGSRSWLISLPIGFGSGKMEFPNNGDALATQQRQRKVLGPGAVEAHSAKSTRPRGSTDRLETILCRFCDALLRRDLCEIIAAPAAARQNQWRELIPPSVQASGRSRSPC
jgi:hypothetical protein